MPVYNANKIRTGPNKGQLKPVEKRRPKPWQCHWYDPTQGKWRDSFFVTKDEADDFDVEKRHQNKTGTAVDDKAGATTIKVYGAMWLATLTLTDSSYRKYAGVLRNHINPKLGHMTLTQARSSTIQEWVKYLTKELGLAPYTVVVSYRILGAIFEAAVRDRAIPFTPCTGVSMPTGSGLRSRQWIPSPQQVAQLIENMPDRYRLAVYLGAGCGLRQMEALGLAVEDIDFLRRSVKVRSQLSHPTGGAACFASTKTATSATAITDVAGDVLDAASYHIRAGYDKPMMMTDNSVHVRPGKPAVQRSARLLFTLPNGRPLRSTDWSDIWAAALAGIDGLPHIEDGDDEEFGFHSLRHYFASVLFDGGASIIQVQGAVRHKKASTTLDVYGHLMKTEDGKTRKAVEAAFAAGRENRKAI